MFNCQGHQVKVSQMNKIVLFYLTFTSDSIYVIQFSVRYPPKCTNHIYPYWIHTGFFKIILTSAFCWLVQKKWYWKPLSFKFAFHLGKRKGVKNQFMTDD